MTELARHLIADVRRGSLAALLLLAGLCAGLAPASGAAQAGRDAPTRLGSARAAPAPSSHRAIDRTQVAAVAPWVDSDGFVPPPTPRIVSGSLAWAGPIVFPLAAAAPLSELLGRNYRARAPPAV